VLVVTVATEGSPPNPAPVDCALDVEGSPPKPELVVPLDVVPLEVVPLDVVPLDVDALPPPPVSSSTMTCAPQPAREISAAKMRGARETAELDEDPMGARIADSALHREELLDAERVEVAARVQHRDRRIRRRRFIRAQRSQHDLARLKARRHDETQLAHLPRRRRDRRRREAPPRIGARRAELFLFLVPTRP
jgi:hypothetical protein